MARQSIIQYIDDLDNTPISESELSEVHFSYQGVDYVIDLGPKNASALYEALKPYIAHARREQKSGRKSAPVAQRQAENRAIRRWALDNGHLVSTRGKIPQDVIDAYHVAKARGQA